MEIRKVFQNAALFFIPIFLLLLIGEITIRIYTRVRTMYDMEMSRYGKQLKIPSANPLIGHVHKPSSSGHLMDVDVQINSDGLRDKEYPVSRNDSHRIIFLGDSLTFGWGVEQDDTFQAVLEGILSKTRPTEIINFGTGNYNTEQEVNLFLEKGLKYKPDQVVLFFFINDAEETPKPSRLSFLEHSEFISFYWSKTRAFLNNFSHTKDYTRYYSDLYAENAKGWMRAREAFSLLNRVCRENGIKLQVIMLPELHVLNDYPFKKEYGLVSRFLEEQGIDHLDLTPSFSREENPGRLWVAPDDAHPNALGHRLIAEYALNFIESGGQ
jgi:lysophospholipase L1-like esterase